MSKDVCLCVDCRSNSSRLLTQRVHGWRTVELSHWNVDTTHRSVSIYLSVYLCICLCLPCRCLPAVIRELRCSTSSRRHLRDFSHRRRGVSIAQWSVGAQDTRRPPGRAPTGHTAGPTHSAAVIRGISWLSERHALMLKADVNWTKSAEPCDSGSEKSSLDDS